MDLLEHKSQMEEVVGSVGSGLAGLHMTGELLGTSIALLRTGSPGRGSLSPVSEAPDVRASRIQQIRKHGQHECKAPDTQEAGDVIPACFNFVGPGSPSTCLT